MKVTFAVALKGEEWAREMGAVPRPGDVIIRHDDEGESAWEVMVVIWRDDPSTVPWGCLPEVVVRPRT